jgi:hypothetical protein
MNHNHRSGGGGGGGGGGGAPPTVIPKSELKLTGEISYIVSSRLESYDDTVTYIILKFSLN